MGITIGEIVKFYRQRIGLSQSELSESICSRKYVGDVETGRSIPTLDIVTLFSQRLGVDLYSVYSSVYRYDDLETYSDCRKLNSAIAGHDISAINAFLEEFEENKRFASGEARQLICYSEAVVLSQKCKYKEAEDRVLEGLKERHPAYPDADRVGFSNVDYSLMLALAVNRGRQGKNRDAEELFDRLATDALAGIALKYDSEKNRAFYLNLLCSAICNKYYYCDTKPEKILSEIDKALDYQRTNSRSHMICELLLCKAGLLKKSCKEAEAQEVYRQAEAIGEFYYGKERFEVLKNYLIKDTENDESDIEG